MLSQIDVRSQINNLLLSPPTINIIHPINLFSGDEESAVNEQYEQILIDVSTVLSIAYGIL